MIIWNIILALGCAADRLLAHIRAVENFIEGLPLGRSGE